MASGFKWSIYNEKVSIFSSIWFWMWEHKSTLLLKKKRRKKTIRNSWCVQVVKARVFLAVDSLKSWVWVPSKANSRKGVFNKVNHFEYFVIHTNTKTFSRRREKVKEEKQVNQTLHLVCAILCVYVTPCVYVCLSCFGKVLPFWIHLWEKST